MQYLCQNFCGHETRTNPKRVNDGPKFELDFYQTVVHYYLQAARAWGWTQEQVDETDINHFFDLITVAILTSDEDKPKKVYADQVGLF